MVAERAVACVVEGHGDVKAMPILVRVLAEKAGVFDLSVLQPHRCPRTRLIAHGPVAGPDLNRVMRLQAGRVGNSGALLVVVDADDDDPSDIAPIIQEVAADLACATIPVVATREYEAWFLAALQSHPLIHDGATWPGDPEKPRDAKGRLAERMVTPYKEVLHQARLTAAMSLEEAAQARQFAILQSSFTHWLKHETPGAVSPST